jgi:trimeric autotransporter adhesin
MLVVDPTTRAILPPPIPDGGYPNGNTAEGDRALQSLTNGSFNTANGNSVLLNNTSGTGNTAVGFQALLNNTGGSLTRPSVTLRSLATQTAAATRRLALLRSRTTTGDYNTALGLDALEFNTIDSFNTASGF